MNKLFIIFLLFISTTLFSQKKDMAYNHWDTTWTLQYHHMISLRAHIEEIKQKKSILEQEVELLNQSGQAKDLVIKKLQVRDSLYAIEIQHMNTIDSLLRDKLTRYGVITDNYQMLLLSTQDQLNATAKQARREKLWKNVYRFGFPALGLAALFILR